MKVHLKRHLKNICKISSKKFGQTSSLRYHKTKHETNHIQKMQIEDVSMTEKKIQQQINSPSDLNLEDGELDGNLEEGEL